MPPLKRVGILGTGAMGRGIAQLLTRSASEVWLVDREAGQATRCVEDIMSELSSLEARGKLAAGSTSRARLYAGSIGDLAACDLVIESVIEDLAVKQALLSEVESVVRGQCVLTTNTSSLSVSAVGAHLRRPERLAGLHFFNPVHAMKIVEVAAGLRTDPELITTLCEWVSSTGHTPVRVKDTPGFIVNHAGRGYLTEALQIAAEGVATFAEIDHVLRDVAGFVMGPFELLDMTGLDVSLAVMQSIYHQSYHEPRYRPHALATPRVLARLHGRKTGEGFYRYDQGRMVIPAESPPPPPTRVPLWVAPAVPTQLRERLLRMAASSDLRASPGPDSLIVIAPLGEDASSVAAREGLDPRRTVAVESLFDTNRRCVLMTTPATTREWMERAHGLLAADGTPVTVIRDSVGLIAQRVVGMIVNIACDIAQQRIASPTDIDLAVSLALRYPFAPLAWGDQLGPRRILTLLERMHACNGDPRYRPSPWLRRRAELGMSLRTADGW